MRLVAHTASPRGRRKRLLYSGDDVIVLFDSRSREKASFILSVNRAECAPPGRLWLIFFASQCLNRVPIVTRPSDGKFDGLNVFNST